VLNLVDNQVRALRKRQVVGSYVEGARKGAYWGIRSNAADYPAARLLQYPYERTQQLADIPTRLERLEPDLQERLINWGYAACDLGLRSHYAGGSPAPKAFPYPLGV
jgi:NTE family protein